MKTLIKEIQQHSEYLLLQLAGMNISEEDKMKQLHALHNDMLRVKLRTPLRRHVLSKKQFKILSYLGNIEGLPHTDLYVTFDADDIIELQTHGYVDKTKIRINDEWWDGTCNTAKGLRTLLLKNKYKYIHDACPSTNDEQVNVLREIQGLSEFYVYPIDGIMDTSLKTVFTLIAMDLLVLERKGHVTITRKGLCKLIDNRR